MTVGFRNLNPSNIVWTGTPIFDGELGPGEGGFARFDTIEHGIAAIASNLTAYQTKHGLKTVRQMISRWSTTDQAAYIKNVSDALGVGPDDPVDLSNQALMYSMVNAIIRQENGSNPYSSDVMLAALGMSAAPAARVILTNPGDWTAIGGGSLADRTDAPAPIEEQSQPVESTVADTPSPFTTMLQTGANIVSLFNPLIGSLANVLISAFAPLAQEKIAAAINKHTDNPEIGKQVATSLVQGAIQLTGKQDPVQATAAAQNDPAVLAQLEKQALDHIDKITSVLPPLADIDKSVWAAEQAGKDAASARAKADPWDMTKALVVFAGLTSTIMVLAILGAILWQVVGQGKEPNTALMSLAGPLFMAALVCWKDIFAYRFDGTKDSAAKDVAIANLAGKP